MNKEEARVFYERKHSRARNGDVQSAYLSIRRIIWEQGTMSAIKAHVGMLSNASDNSVRRAIYRKALREMNI